MQISRLDYLLTLNLQGTFLFNLSPVTITVALFDSLMRNTQWQGRTNSGEQSQAGATRDSHHVQLVIANKNAQPCNLHHIWMVSIAEHPFQDPDFTSS